MYIKINFLFLKQLNFLKTFFHRNFSKVDNTHIFRILSDMSRPLDKHVAEAQKARKFVKERYSKYAPGTVTLQVLGSGAAGSPKSVFMFTDQSRYLFNCGEGTQRLAHEHKMKLARLEHVFFTNASWTTLGGLPGMALTLQDVGVPKITLHGPPRLDDLFTATRKFVIMKDMKIEMADCTKASFYDDAVMTVKYVPLTRKPDSSPPNSPTHSLDLTSAEVQVEPDNTDYYAHDSTGRYGVQNTHIDILLNEPRNEQLCTMAYICRLKSCPGQLDLQKCVNKGVKPGPALGMLKNGQNVTLPDGTIVYSKDVKTPDDPGSVFIVLDIPEERFLDSLMDSEVFKVHQEGSLTLSTDEPDIIIHFTPDHIVKNERYQAFMKAFPANTSHMFVNDGNLCSGSMTVHRVQHKLNLLDDDIFPLLKDYGIPISPKSFSPEAMARILNKMANLDPIIMDQFKNKLNFNSNHLDHDNEKNPTNHIYAKTFTSFHLRPKRGLDSSCILNLDIPEYILESMNEDGFPESLCQFYSEIADLKPKTIQSYPRIVFMGTGSCIPNKSRNTSGIVLHLDENSCILMDCGEGTYGQMVRFYGKDAIDSVMKNLKAIYLSHLHADHHIGLIGVLQGRRRALESLGISQEDHPKIYLLAPKQIMSWLYVYDRRFERIVHEIQIISNSSLNKKCSDFTKPEQSFLDHLGLSSLETCYVRHCPNSFGVSLITKQSKKITYSGDTMPCKELISIGMNSDLLIHEATMEDDLADEAKWKMHSTTGQAVGVGRSMEAAFILLTHFSQRYSRLPRLTPETLGFSNVGVAFDNMQITLDDLPLLPLMYAPLKLMFAEQSELLEQRAAKRALKRERALSPASAQISRSMATNAPSRKLKPSVDEDTIAPEAINDLDGCSITDSA